MGILYGQTRQALKNLEQILLAAGTDLKHVVKTLVFVSNIDEFPLSMKNTRSSFQSIRLRELQCRVGKFLNGMVVEIEAVAVIPED